MTAPSQTPEAAGLKPCPFCGGTTIMTYSQAITEGPDFYWHKCGDCGAETEGDYGQDAAAAVWNRRVTAASAQAAIDAEKAKVAKLEVALEEARTIDAGFWKWLGERDLQPDGPDGEWGDIVVALIEHENNAYDIADKANDRATAAEARADRLAETEGDLTERGEACLSLLPSCGGAMAKARIMGKAQAYLHAAELVRAALQQETQK